MYIYIVYTYKCVFILNIYSNTSERRNITNDLLLPILTSLETEATTENNNAAEESIEADFLEEFQSHTRGT